MKANSSLFFLFICFVVFSHAQTNNPSPSLKTIKATSKNVDIRDDNAYQKNAWTIVPEAKPDVYTTTSKNKFVTFYTDKDSIRIKVDEKKPYRFIILLKDSIQALTEVRYQPSKLDILKAAKVFQPMDKRTLPAFTYQDSSFPALKILRKELKLDSIAGGGNEISRIINLMHWIHNLVPHDGQHGNPEVKNAMSMIKVCKAEKRGLNCRGLATVLNECYLSLGIKSRFLTCLPKDTADPDCHVINMVYSRDLKKWIWMDPTNDAYVMDEKGTLLSPEEVRERLITNKMLILNPDANWNHKSSVDKNYLYEYMAKNLYRFECNASSEYDTETSTEGKTRTYVQLLPLDYWDQKPDYSENKYEKKQTVFKVYKTNNPNQFWQTPY